MLPVAEILEQILGSTVLTVLLAGAIFILLCWRKLLEKRLYPPGPIPLPFIGNDYVMLREAWEVYKYKYWNKKFGNVVSYVSRGKWFVDLYGYDAIHECFVQNADYFSERPTAAKTFGHAGLFSQEKWPELRKQAFSLLKKLGMGKAEMEVQLRNEIDYNCELLLAMKGQQSSVTFKDTISLAVCNILSQKIFGTRLDYDDENLFALCRFDLLFPAKAKSRILPFSKYLPWDPFEVKKHQKTFEKVISFSTNQIHQHKASLDFEHSKDYINDYLTHGIKTGDTIFKNEDCLRSCIYQIFLGGFDTTSTTLTWNLLYLVNYPLLQEKLYEEIQDVIGTRPVTMADKGNLHFVQAFIHEAFRASGIGIHSMNHLCTRDTVIQGHNIPKGTVVIAHLYSTNFDENVYPDPHIFKPERFLDSHGHFVSPSGKQMLPFSIGKRSCPGETLARSFLFMKLVTLVQRFQFRRLTEELLPEDGIDLFIHTSKTFHFDLQPRN